MPDVGVLVTARTASTRLPRKAFVDIAGRPSIGHVMERLLASRPLLQVVLCTTTEPQDDELAAFGASHHVGVFRGPSEDVARRLLGALDAGGFKHFVRVTGDSPLVCHTLIGHAVAAHLESSADYTCLPNVYYGGAPEVVSGRALRTITEHAVESANTEYLSWYLDNPERFRVNRVAVDPRYERPYRLTLDTVEDLEVIRAVYKALYQPGLPVDPLRALEWLDSHPDVARTNAAVPLKVRREDLNVSLHP